MNIFRKRKTQNRKKKRDSRQGGLPFPIQSRVDFNRNQLKSVSDQIMVGNLNKCPSCGSGNFVWACHYQCKNCGFMLSCDD